ncbi:cation:proton antiporter [Microbispora sp. RL4-1S]|uniref:Cation:proton antiporter n=1 Tax=Microbispora oryzae TaxID=2806554 RepID=A0A940WM30_9ACTN|nr:cation:proton antiporter [Microbispora oryzae]MBP2705862.1 cation:proton antiporter [Microbispora oryzae]
MSAVGEPGLREEDSAPAGHRAARGRFLLRGVRLPIVVALLAAAAVLAGVRAGALPSPSTGVDPLARFLIAVVVVLVVCHLFGGLLELAGQPPAIGEILGGLVLGPSALGLLWPEGQRWLFSPEVVSVLGQTAQLGLVTFMFLVGYELRLDALRTDRRAVGLGLVGSLALPLVLGAAAATPAYTMLAGPDVPRVTYVLFMALALSITALPVLARLLTDLGLTGSRTGTLALACAAGGDVVAWTALTLVLALRGDAGWAQVVSTALVVLVLGPVAVPILRSALAWALRTLAGTSRGARLTLPVLAAGATACGALTQVLGLHPVIGAFLFGVVVPRDMPVVERAVTQLHGFAVGLLLPLFFAGVGLQVSVGLLDHGSALLVFAAITLVSTAAKIFGSALAVRPAGLNRSEALGFGALMNCRGVTEIVVALVGWENGIVNTLALTMLVLLALLATAVTAPLLRVVGRLDR